MNTATQAPVDSPTLPTPNGPADLLRFTTAGSVDDGKSTLIGRLLYDAKSVLMDQWEAMERTSQRKGLSHVDLSLLTDGLKDEREQGITIDVAYRYFSTPARTFIIADTPGHVQYTRNMVTGASTADVALLLVDARNGVVEQTRRHLFLAGLLGLPVAVVCINKMDLVDWSESVFQSLCADAERVAREAGVRSVRFIPLSALLGDNVVDRSAHMPWYTGEPLLRTLETLEVPRPENDGPFRLSVQTVLRPHTTEHHDFRGYAGRVASGTISVGDPITAYPGGLTSRVSALWLGNQPLTTAHRGQSIALELADDLDVARGSLLAHSDHPQPVESQQVEATLCWLDRAPQLPGAKYAVRCATAEVRGLLDTVDRVLDLHTLVYTPTADPLRTNDLAHVRLRLAKPLATDAYTTNRVTGAFILVDESTGATVAAGMISSHA